MAKIYSVEILPPAQAELEETARVHLALSGPLSARGITDRIYESVERLARYPLSGHPTRDEQLRAGGCRFVIAGKYMVFYRLIGEAVVIYHIAHGAADYPKLFKNASA
ncbi:addiction module toxin RelE [Cloacibacillus sp. An23]|nr:addiction module toxin RelE [Cloacibacillus sp. An23]